MACLDLARMDKAQTVGLYTSERMTAARHLYESLGFYQDYEVPSYFGMRYFGYRLDIASE
jgi:ribosomal protein S18 acetylase RimI-like enzyme